MYLFELGRIKKLSLAELNNLFGEENLVEIIDHFAIYNLETLHKEPQDLQDKLGGTIKIAEIVDHFTSKTKDPKKKIESSLKTILTDHFKDRSGKIPFALTAVNVPDNPKVFLKQFLSFSKKTIKSLGFNSRFVNKPWQNATTAQISKSGSVQKGIDLTILGGKATLYIAKTLSIQNINSYSYRDYKKPFRDPKMGMLPPKLAQIMINLAEPALSGTGAAKEAHTIFDPFCGSGTILMEALLQRKDAIGSDIDEKAVEGTLANLCFVVKNFDNTTEEFAIFHKDAKQIQEKDLTGIPDAIVTETHLGPPVSKLPKEENLQKTFDALTELHEAWLTNLSPLLKPGTKLVICLPTFRKFRKEYIRFPHFDQIAKKANLEILNPEPLIYERPDQVVAREIVVLQVKG
ncbi:hypothetical protein HOG17_04375 [Candidatus Peregrinibacteria bacterium]|jgi:tRNA G10  N-methylase Trm11|nr:hypothetical protein [Candidatus Peregrinibacteria bacterium]MBT4148455.1 hypothetical protein [Candidatus Peregrinibacteria bacterium]MBT4366538.1 hypothetical protein [Candidatus Peregrinibacteria bacterium]MBT4456496.1 hypothetical protein [Candidatus Peregrinibacteria bacterium]